MLHRRYPALMRRRITRIGEDEIFEDDTIEEGKQEDPHRSNADEILLP